MKTRQEQIEELAETILKSGIAIEGTDFAFGITNDKEDHFSRLSRKLYSVSYRKASDVIDEFVERLEGKGNIEFNPANGKEYLVIKIEKIHKIAEEIRKEVEK